MSEQVFSRDLWHYGIYVCNSHIITKELEIMWAIHSSFIHSYFCENSCNDFRLIYSRVTGRNYSMTPLLGLAVYSELPRLVVIEVHYFDFSSRLCHVNMRQWESCEFFFLKKAARLRDFSGS